MKERDTISVVLGRDMVQPQYPTLEEILAQNVGVEFEHQGITYKIVVINKGDDDGSTT